MTVNLTILHPNFRIGSRNYLVAGVGIEPTYVAYETTKQPLLHPAILEGSDRFELSI
jgi:hypothetical protein